MDVEEEEVLSSPFFKRFEKIRAFIKDELERRAEVTGERLEDRLRLLEEKVALLEDDTAPSQQDADVEWNYNEQRWEGSFQIPTKRRDRRQKIIHIGDMVKMEEKSAGRWAGRSVRQVIGVTEGGNIKISCDGVEGHTRIGNRTLEII